MPDETSLSLPDRRTSADPVPGVYPARWARVQIKTDWDDIEDTRTEIHDSVEIIRLMACGADASWAKEVRAAAEGVIAALACLGVAIDGAEEASDAR